jgi:hypothetical protein
METKELIVSKYAELQEEQLKARQDFKERTNALLESAMEHSPIKVDERITHSGVDYIITTIEPYIPFGFSGGITFTYKGKKIKKDGQPGKDEQNIWGLKMK